MGTTYCVIDIETTPDPVAVSLAGAKGSDPAAELHRLSACSTLVATERDGTWTVPTLSTFGTPSTEFDLLMSLDAVLASLLAENPTIVSYNGVTHDLAVIRRRSATHWMFGLEGLGSLARLPHEDLMETATRSRRQPLASLRNVCAGLGIPTDHQFVDPYGKLGRQARKCQVDVVATFLLLLYELAIRRRDPTPLAGGWTALEGMLDNRPGRPPHLEQFRGRERLRAYLERDPPSSGNQAPPV